MVYAFGDCGLDEDLFQIRRRGKMVKVEPKVFDVLAYLCRHGDRVVSKDELLDAVWPGQAVSESVLPKCIAAARRAVGDNRAPCQVIATVHGRGYRFVAAVERLSSGTPTMGTAAAPVAAGEGGSPSSPFVGRAHAMERLRKSLDDACAGHGRVVLLAGEPGIGKTRTAEEFAADAWRVTPACSPAVPTRAKARPPSGRGCSFSAVAYRKWIRALLRPTPDPGRQTSPS